MPGIEGLSVLPRRMTRRSHIHHRATVISVAQRDDLCAARIDASQHHRGLVGFRAAVGEEALLQFARRDLGNLLCKLCLRAIDVERRGVSDLSYLIAIRLRRLRGARGRRKLSARRQSNRDNDCLPCPTRAFLRRVRALSGLCSKWWRTARDILFVSIRDRQLKCPQICFVQSFVPPRDYIDVRYARLFNNRQQEPSMRRVQAIRAR